MKKKIVGILFLACVSAQASPASEAANEALRKKDYKAAAKLFRPIAESGDRAAQFNLGMWYYEGLGVSQDYAESAKWYQLAASQGDVLSKYNLSLMYNEGRGVIQDFSAAFSLMKEAAESGCSRCQDTLGTFYRDGTGTTPDRARAYMWFNIAASDTDPYRSKMLNATEHRYFVANEMSAEQLSQAQQMTRQCLQNALKKCGEPMPAQSLEVHQPAPTISIERPQQTPRGVTENEVNLASANGYFLIKLAMAVGTFLALSFGLLKSSKDTPVRNARWIGAYAGAAAVLAIRAPAHYPNVTEFIAASVVLISIVYAAGFSGGYAWRRYRPL